MVTPPLTDFYGKREGEMGKLDAGEGARFDQITNGMPGLETRMPVLYHRGVNEGRISVNDFVALTSTNAAKLFGAWRAKLAPSQCLSGVVPVLYWWCAAVAHVSLFPLFFLFSLAVFL